MIPPNCQVAMALHGVHFDPILYPNPKKWNPQNFTQEAIESRPKHSFMAFGCGPRACIGMCNLFYKLSASCIIQYEKITVFFIICRCKIRVNIVKNTNRSYYTKISNTYRNSIHRFTTRNGCHCQK